MKHAPAGLHQFMPASSPEAPPLMPNGGLHQERTHDVHELACSITGWQQLYHQLKPGVFDGELTELWLDGVQIYTENTNIALLQNCLLWPNSYWFGCSPCTDVDTDSTCSALQPAHLGVASGGRAFELSTPQNFSIQGLVIKQALLEQSVSCEPAAEQLMFNLNHANFLAVNPQKKKHFRQLLAQIMLFGQHCAASLQQENVRKSLQQDLLEGLLALIRDAQPQFDRLTHHSRHYQTLVSKARDFVLSHPYESLSVMDLAMHLNVSRRTLQNGFLSVLNLSPLAYLKAIRLNAVRRELQNTHSHHHTVQDAAMAWGFWHLGQFSADYRRFFSERPSTTLASRGRVEGIWQRQSVAN